MAADGIDRKLTTILAADVAGYSRMMAADEEATLRTLTAYRTIIFDLLKKHQGRLVDTAGDSVLADFGSPVEAVRCAISIQEELAVRNAELAEDRRMLFRIGINVGDVIVEGDNIFGDAVNVAARLEGVAVPGSVCISGSTFEQVKNKLSIGFTDIGPQSVKNIPQPVAAYQLSANAPETRRGGSARRRNLWLGLAAGLVIGLAGVGAYAVWTGERAAERAEALRLKAEAAAERNRAEEASRRLEETRKAVEAERRRAAEEGRRRAEARREAEAAARQRAAEEARKRAETEARERAEAEARERAQIQARQRAQAEARRRAAAAAKRKAAAPASRSQVAVNPGALRAAQVQALLVGRTARFERRHRFKPGKVVFLLTFAPGGVLRLGCTFHPDRNPTRQFPCRAGGKTYVWRMDGERICWSIRAPICFTVARQGAGYVMQPTAGSQRAILRGPFRIVR